MNRCFGPSQFPDHPLRHRVNIWECEKLISFVFALYFLFFVIIFFFNQSNRLEKHPNGTLSHGFIGPFQWPFYWQ